MAIMDIEIPKVSSVLPAAGAASVALLISLVVPLAGPLLVALILGAVVANTRVRDLDVMQGHTTTTTMLSLRLGIVLLGLRLPVGDLIDIGVPGIVIVLATVLITYTSTIFIGDRLGLERGFVTLLAAGFSICGAAAIAAVDNAVRARQKDVALAVALVTLYGSAMILALPWLAGRMGLTTKQSAMWAGASIHEVAQVVAAASIIGSGALAVATTVKLGRVVLLAPMYALASRRCESRGSGRRPAVPWFVVGFAIAIALRTSGLLGAGQLHAADLATTFLLAAGMFGLGLGIRAREIWPVPVRALILATCSTVVAATVSLCLIALLA